MPSEPARTPGLDLSLQSVSKDFAGVPAVSSVSLDVAAGEFITFLGPSGSGKTTTLNMIAGFVTPSAGRILLDGRDISHVPPHKRGIGMVFQHYALFPHMTVEQNVAYPLKQRKVGRDDRVRRVRETLELVQLGALGGRRPAELSGGQQQRVALARALVFRPPVLLMDEPLGALDRRLRETLQVEIKRVHEELGITFIYVTHDQDEALRLSDRIAIFRDGQIDQIGTAEELYERPRTQFVAEFLGDSNTFPGHVGPTGQVVCLEDGSQLRAADLRGARAGQQATLMVRPERVHVIGAEAPPRTDRNVVGDCRVASIRYWGAGRTVEVSSPTGRRILVAEPVDRSSGVRTGDAVQVCWRPEDSVVVADAARPQAAAVDSSPEGPTG